ncbi:hypothetical protein R3P38DRAFT_2777280 [Favolaschia claudopus]|uniref:Uncharacterized protein n=1 Tax=Favolaschia claudopus TaxID=2862362 RepID=A0AAW0BML4_9AGAR
MSSSVPTTPPANPLGDIFGAMDEESPVAPSLTTAQKRNHSAIDNSGSDDEESSRDTLPTTASNPSQNTAVIIQRYCEKKRLRADQTNEVIRLVHEPPGVSHGKLLANIFQVSNQITAIVTAQAPWEVSTGLLKNIDNYGAAVFLSTKISAYKGSVPTNTLLNILKRLRFDLPPNIENNPADYLKLVAAVQEAFTQLRAKVKKMLFASLKVNKSDKTIAPGPDHQNIFKLTLALVDGTQCTVTVELCARVALMRSVYLRDSGPKFWDKLDSTLAEIRNNAEGDAKKLTRAFRHILTKDQELHGVKNYEITASAVENFQQEVDDLIDAGNADLATSVAPSAAAGPQADDGGEN